MRKRYRVLLMAALIACLAVPLGFALSLTAQREPAIARRDIPVTIATPVTNSFHSSPNPILDPLRDAAKLMLVGAMLIGVAALVRKTT